MGLFSWIFPNLDVSNATNNALLVELMLPRLTETEEEKCSLAHSVADIYRAGGFRSYSDMQALGQLDKQRRIVQLNFIALALDANQIPPFISGQMWIPIKNPFRLGNIPQSKIDSWVEASVHFLTKSHPELISPEAKRVGISLSIKNTPLCFTEWVNTPTARIMSLANGWVSIDD